MTELSFLLELLLNHKLAKATKEAITVRIKEVEANLAKPIISNNHGNITFPATNRPIQNTGYNQPQTVTLTNPDGTKSEIDLSKQSPSTRAKLLQESAQTQGQLAVQTGHEATMQSDIPPPPVPVTQVAQTPAAAAALQSRHDAIRIAVSGKEEKGRSSPRKF